jgi:hypothetical protein
MRSSDWYLRSCEISIAPGRWYTSSLLDFRSSDRRRLVRFDRGVPATRSTGSTPALVAYRIALMTIRSKPRNGLASSTGGSVVRPLLRRLFGSALGEQWRRKFLGLALLALLRKEAPLERIELLLELVDLLRPVLGVRLPAAVVVVTRRNHPSALIMPDKKCRSPFCRRSATDRSGFVIGQRNLRAQATRAFFGSQAMMRRVFRSNPPRSIVSSVGSSRMWSAPGAARGG